MKLGELRDLSVRYFVSSGLGGFGLIPTEKSIIYIAALTFDQSYIDKV